MVRAPTVRRSRAPRDSTGQETLANDLSFPGGRVKTSYGSGSVLYKDWGEIMSGGRRVQEGRAAGSGEGETSYGTVEVY